ncbi:hypothetical protein SERLADRAFT_448663 [Serpula lacrymans var. lacrymans S7.9]|uniref:Spindle pole body component n=1 Tax=Serpula lacrymans var. lacrymans (strain S7.9) TaxID=578457 RepID=F8NTQ5_SERL9|nr:uncharacterized protein SERLADRAFT_448663 [Serpula lacrymans var. lacrymans S7.9]EGO25726.1 hypothetical protein SERLADRAFT_448663 [Serpula lacrymans var. lacrymans S7.9]
MSLITDALELEDEVLSPIEGLSPILPQFFVPRLADKPQNPILHNLDLMSHIVSKPAVVKPLLPPELAILTQDIHQPQQTRKSLWAEAITSENQLRCQIKTWDGLRSSFRQKSFHTPFISEQSDQVFASAQYHVQPVLSSSSANVTYVTQDEMLVSLKMVVLGTSSSLHSWDKKSETFIRVGLDKGVNHSLLIDGRNETISRSFLQRFLDIGTLVRRLELFVTYLRKRDGPTVHAFAHALSSTLAYVRNTLSSLSPNITGTQSKSNMLSAIWLRYGDLEGLLISLSSLCHRELRLSPPEYPAFETSSVPLLNRVYQHLRSHIESSSLQLITATFAYLLTKSSQDCIQRVCQSVAYGDGNQRASLATKQSREAHSSDLFGANEAEEDENDDADSAQMEDEYYPAFIPPELANILPAARKSLKLLLAARPDHPILQKSSASEALVWLWTESEVKAVYEGHAVDNKDERLNDRNVTNGAQKEADPDADLAQNLYKPELAQFHVFDMEPGSCQQESLFGSTSGSLADAPLRSFISTFPKALPSIVPNLELLTSLVFSPLVKHASSLSRAVLSLFLEQDSALYLHDHLNLLRSYMLLTSDSFKSRLATALFSDSEDRETSDENVKAFRLSRQPQRHAKASKTGPWAVGLAPVLIDRESWPPGGTDLSYFLRTVIMDSMEIGHPSMKDDLEDQEKCGRRLILNEAEYRLGFAIRDLPIGAGRDQWLNPLCEALDFLYLDYKAPHPLDVIITPEILSKYQRMFAFLLRLMRVESAIRADFRMSRKRTEPLFPTLTSSNKLFLHFRFVAQTFVNALSAYVYDVAIGGNYDVFLSRIVAAQSYETPDSDDGFSDVFALASSHSAVLDDILSACLLRSGQRAVGDLLRKTLELVLEFSILTGDLKSGRLQEYQAASLLEDLFQLYCKKMSTLVKVLEALLEKGAKSSQLQREILMLKKQESDAHHPPGGMESLGHLLSRINANGWWKGSTGTATDA